MLQLYSGGKRKNIQLSKKRSDHNKKYLECLRNVVGMEGKGIVSVTNHLINETRAQKSH